MVCITALQIKTFQTDLEVTLSLTTQQEVTQLRIIEDCKAQIYYVFPSNSNFHTLNYSNTLIPCFLHLLFISDYRISTQNY